MNTIRLAAVALVLGAAPAHAQDETQAAAAGTRETFTPSLRLSAAGDIAAAIGDFCLPTSSDTVMCSSLVGYRGLGGGLQARLWPHWSVGFGGAFNWSEWRGGITVEGLDGDNQYRLLQLAMAGRWHWLDSEAVDPFLQLDLGFAKSWTAFRGAESGIGVTSPALGGAVGVDFSPLDALSLGVGMHVQYIPFPEGSLRDQRVRGAHLSGSAVVCTLGATVGVVLPLED